MRTSFSLRATILTLLILVVGVISETYAHEDGTVRPGKDHTMNVMADVTPANRGDTLPLCLAPFMQTIGRPEWSMTRLEGVMGHAFQFQMKEGGEHVMHDAIDWGVALDALPQIAQFRAFSATKRDTDIDLPALKREARDAVRAGLLKGQPALVWQPMSVEMKANHHHGYCWGLIVGYNEAEETYTIRHPYVSDTYTIKYDDFGGADGAEWFNVKVFEEQTTVDEKTTHLTALRNAIAFANGTRFAPDKRQKDRPIGFAAYELWRAAFKSEDIPLEPSRHHAETVKGRRLSPLPTCGRSLQFSPKPRSRSKQPPRTTTRSWSRSTRFTTCAPRRRKRKPGPPKAAPKLKGSSPTRRSSKAHRRRADLGKGCDRPDRGCAEEIGSKLTGSTCRVTAAVTLPCLG